LNRALEFTLFRKSKRFTVGIAYLPVQPVQISGKRSRRGSAFLRFQDGRTKAAQPLPASLLQRDFRCGIGEPFTRCSTWKAGWHMIPHAGCVAAFNWQAAADCGPARAELCYV